MHAQARVRWFPRRVPAVDAAATLPRFSPADFDPLLKTRLLILQPTPFCNIDCDYCYLPARHDTARMSVATVRLAAQRLRDAGLVGERLGIVWHAGEPTVIPPAWYDEAIAALNEVLGAQCELSQSIQTNATLIDDAWCELILRHRISVGVSVDGPAELHDAHRRTRTGHGTHARVLRGMAMLRAHRIEFHAISVVTPATFAQADAFFDFFDEQGVSEVGCNFDEAEGLHARSSLAGHEAAHAAFITRLIERSREAGQRASDTSAGGGMVVRELAQAMQLIAAPLPTYEWQGRRWPENAQTMPFALVNVAHNGDFSTFSPELLGQPSAEFGNFVFGNVARDDLLDASESEAFERVWGAIVRGTSACEASCAHYGFCGGGAPANKLYENGDLASTETLYCRTMIKRPFDAVLAHLERHQHIAGDA